MKVAVTATGPNLDADVDPRFGRCPYFLIVETDDMTFEALENPNVSVGGGAGIQSAQLVAEKGAKVVLTGNCGPNAYQALSAGGVEVIVGVSGKVRDAVEQYKAGAFAAAQQPSVPSHFGMGMGPGMGRGMGFGMGRGMAARSAAAVPQDEVAALRQQLEAIQQQLNRILERIKDLEK